MKNTFFILEGKFQKLLKNVKYWEVSLEVLLKNKAGLKNFCTSLMKPRGWKDFLYTVNGSVLLFS